MTRPDGPRPSPDTEWWAPHPGPATSADAPPDPQHARSGLGRRAWGVAAMALVIVSAAVLLDDADQPMAPDATPSASSSTAVSPPTATSRATPMTSPTTADPTPTASPTPTAERGESGLVTHIVDGDTLDVAGFGRIRIIGIDTPERGACGFDDATAALAAMVDGQTVTLTAGARDDVDRYGRLLRYVDIGGIDAGLRLVEDGWAIARYDSRDGYGRHTREDAYVAADAASEDLGCYDE